MKRYILKRLVISIITTSLALRDALETNKEVVGAHGVYNMSAEDHFGLDTRGRVLVRIENGGYSMIGQ